MTHHLAKHQNPDENVLIQKKYEANLEKQRLKHEDVRQKMMEVGMEELEAGNIKMNASVLRGVAKDTSDIEEKNKDRQLKVLEMLNAFISGEITNTEVIDADSTESPISYLEG
jgi:RNA polymerase-interacting CarD/CdnL/TRCF family regulator